MAWYGVILLSSRLSLWDNAKENHLITGFCSTMLPSLLSQLLSQGLQGCLSVVPYAVRFAGQNVWGTSALCLWKRLNDFIWFLLLAWCEQMKKWDSEVIPTCFSSTLPAFFTSSAQDCHEPCFNQGVKRSCSKDRHWTAANTTVCVAAQWGEHMWTSTWELEMKSKWSNWFVRNFHVTMSLVNIANLCHSMLSCQPQDLSTCQSNSRILTGKPLPLPAMQWMTMLLLHLLPGRGPAIAGPVPSWSWVWHLIFTVILLPPILNTPLVILV